MNLEKLKDTARKYEQKEDWRRAIDAYLQAIQAAESGRDPAPDLSLYNRIGDLYLKINDSASAVRSYERAVDLYADQGFLNNAIALCGKILRVNPGRLPTYLKLAQLHARKNFLHDAKRYLIEYLERMNAVGQLDDAFAAVKGFADHFSNNQEIRLMLVDLLRATSRDQEAREQLEKLAAELEARGDQVGARKTRERLQAIHDNGELDPPSAPATLAGGLVFLDTAAQEAGSGSAVAEPEEDLMAAPPDGLVEESLDGLDTEPLDGSDTEPLDDLEATAIGQVDELEAAPIDGLDVDEPAPFEVEQSPVLDLEPTEFGAATVEMEDTDLVLEPEFEAMPPMDGLELGASDGDQAQELEPDAEPVDLEFVDAELDGDLDEALWSPDGTTPDGDLLRDDIPLEPMSAPELPYVEGTAPAEGSLNGLEDRVLDDPGNPDAHRELADALAAADATDRAREEYDLALQGYETAEAWDDALDIVTRVLAVVPDQVGLYQKQVELAYRTGRRPQLLDAYLGLADALARLGEPEKAMAVYQRVLEHDPENARAEQAIAGLTAALPAEEPEAEPEPEAAEPEAAEPEAPEPVPAMAPPAMPAAAAPAGSDNFVDLGSIILEGPVTPRDTRMKLDAHHPSGDEQRDFEDMLAAFRRGIAENVSDEDYEAHYDLGVAFKEMGLLDEAIAEFQKALRAPAGRLRTAEALGSCFFDKSQFAVAEAVLRRAVDGLEGPDDEKIGLIYWLGRAAEAQGKDRDALTSYQRALAVDIRFMDLSERIHRLTAGPRS